MESSWQVKNVSRSLTGAWRNSTSVSIVQCFSENLQITGRGCVCVCKSESGSRVLLCHPLCLLVLTVLSPSLPSVLAVDWVIGRCLGAL